MSWQRSLQALKSMLEILDLPLEAKGSHLINLESILKYHNLISAVEDAIVSYGIGIMSFFCIGKGLTQIRSILVPGARTKALGPE